MRLVLLSDVLEVQVKGMVSGGSWLFVVGFKMNGYFSSICRDLIKRGWYMMVGWWEPGGYSSTLYVICWGWLSANWDSMKQLGVLTTAHMDSVAETFGGTYPQSTDSVSCFLWNWPQGNVPHFTSICAALLNNECQESCIILHNNAPLLTGQAVFWKFYCQMVHKHSAGWSQVFLMFHQ